MWYERDIDKDNTPTECVICIEAENEMYTKYAHPKAHLVATALAFSNAEKLAIKEKDTESYIDYYIFHYGREYRRIFSGTTKAFATWELATSTIITMNSSGWAALTCAKNSPIRSVFI